jgi:predicted dehydrogenase
VPVDAPDWISLSGRLGHGAEVSFLVATVPSSPSGNRFEIYGREGALMISGGSPNNGPLRLHGARGKEPLSPMEIPQRFTLVPQSTPAGPPRNVAQAYARLARAITTGERFEPDFAHAVKRHTLIEAIERSSADGRAVRV